MLVKGQLNLARLNPGQKNFSQFADGLGGCTNIFQALGLADTADQGKEGIQQQMGGIGRGVDHGVVGRIRITGAHKGFSHIFSDAFASTTAARVRRRSCSIVALMFLPVSA